MKMRVKLKYYFLSVTFIGILVSCKKSDEIKGGENNPTAVIHSNDDQEPGWPGYRWRTLFSEERKHPTGFPEIVYWCWDPASTCLPTVIIKPEENPYINTPPAYNAFKEAVSDENTSGFFGSTDAQILFPLLSQDTLDILADENITMIQAPFLDSIGGEYYFAVYITDLADARASFQCDTIISDTTVQKHCVNAMIKDMYDNGDILFAQPIYDEDEIEE